MVLLSYRGPEAFAAIIAGLQEETEPWMPDSEKSARTVLGESQKSRTFGLS
jgi:hypothetical protein